MLVKGKQIEQATAGTQGRDTTGEGVPETAGDNTILAADHLCHAGKRIDVKTSRVLN